MLKMDPELKAKWLEALRSGKYRQAVGALRRNADSGDSFCCLGVLCDVLDPNDWTEEDITYSWGLNSYGKDERQGAVLPTPVTEQYHISRNRMWDLTGLNDKGKSFSEIADWIEDHL